MKKVSFKRILLHVAFWLAYLAQDITLIYLWDKDKHPGVSISHQLMFAVLNSQARLSRNCFFAIMCFITIFPNF